ncbi:Ferredoxin--NAD(+) reductase [Thiorhodococcus drewsii AZ1]|uniref:Ferredoxin--NAD(+) reductase n=1 Tax=Thiorhodococcus drewsii AZ1 TaxID=765913 RepID=G2E2V7_9GAMM|nr:2Fe-2S iron-sulfur cluster-binding protein [Thiorhodococcus drewsii]EGV30661.1 Ferredoxin--NAD(+) reductase [Thiorhodococcus drewsii AZ1]
MSYLSLSRAARLAGITRSELQCRIRRGEIQTFEGSIAVEDLLRAFPSTRLDDDSALERVERIKREALPKREETETRLPDAQVLVARLHGLSEGLANRIAELDATKALLDETSERLTGLADLSSSDLPDALDATRDWLVERRRQLDADDTSSNRTRLFVNDTFLRIMAANVKLIPSGHDFFVEGNESILDASVRAGLKMNYGCSSGNCGDCKARVVSGETWRIRDHDYLLSEREKAMGYILTCSHTAVTDLVIEAAEANKVTDLPHQRIRASVRTIDRRSPTLISLQLRTPRTQTLRFMAGQRVQLTLANGESRELPIASCPCNGRNLWFLIRRGADAFSTAIFDTVKQGQNLEIAGPHGTFILTEDTTDPAVFIAFDEGIAPIKSLIEHAISIDMIESFALYWETRQPEGHHESGWCRALRDALGNFEFIPSTGDAPEQIADQIAQGRIDRDRHRFYIAGPAELVGRMISRLTEMGIPEERIASERLED